MKVTIKGMDDVYKVLGTIAPREAVNLMRGTTLDIAKTMAEDAKPHTPDNPATKQWVGDAFSAKRARGTRTTVRAETVVKKVGRSFIWKFLEYGTGPEGVEHAMFLKSFQTMKGKLMSEYLRVFGARLEKRLKRARK